MNDFVQKQQTYWRGADAVRFDWQTRNPVLARREAALAQRVLLRAGERLLEIGCGEGANLHHLRDDGALRFGVDFSSEKASFARNATGAATVTADGALLPFADGGFDAVLIRDVLHHVPAPAAVLAEARRVLAPGGRLVLVEPNRNSPLIWAQAALIPAERAVLRSTAARLGRQLADAGFVVARHSYEQPLPLERILLHPTMGLPQLGSLSLVERALAAIESVARRLVPERAWMYLVFEASRPEIA
ncbi:MAG TPA: methyltransferase domain-containing protein [Polyangia bacterium]|nr:methyltransferase domain-containing protein [Polyangia bacterium]